MSGIRGRPLKYDRDTKLAYLATYAQIPKGERVEFARHLGISLNTLMVYMSQWRKELYGEGRDENIHDVEERPIDVHA
jgi:hypothetical protein